MQGNLPAPSLVAPGNGDGGDQTITLTWNYGAALRPGQEFLVQLRTDQNQEKKSLDKRVGYANLPIQFDSTDEYREFFKIPGTKYFWKVTVISGGQPISPASEERFFYFYRREEEQPTPTVVPRLAQPEW